MKRFFGRRRAAGPAAGRAPLRGGSRQAPSRRFAAVAPHGRTRCAAAAKKAFHETTYGPGAETSGFNLFDFRVS